MNAVEQLTPATGPIVIQETFAGAFREGTRMFRAHAKEIGLTRLPHPWKPAMNLYGRAEKAGLVIWLSVRDENFKLIGYAMYLIGPSTLFSGKTHASLEWIYVQPERRSVALTRQLWQEGLRLVREKGAVSICREMWVRQGGKHPIQVAHWTFLE